MARTPARPVAQAVESQRTGVFPLLQTVGCRSAEMIVPYPPGIPLLYAGERITEPVAALLNRLAQNGASFQGASDPTLATLRIYRDDEHDE